MTQPPLPLLYRDALSQADFILTAANEAAVAQLALWPDWPTGLLVLIGPPGAGKSHLVRAMAAHLAAADPEGAQLDICDPLEEARTTEALFHRMNAAQAPGHFLLMTARSDPAGWPDLVPDIRSRLATATRCLLADPDDEMMHKLLAKRLKDRGLAVAPAVIDYVARRIDRSYPAVHAAVHALDDGALGRRRDLTVPLARELLDTACRNISHNSSIDRL